MGIQISPWFVTAATLEGSLYLNVLFWKWLSLIVQRHMEKIPN